MRNNSSYSGKMVQDEFGEYPIEADGSFIIQRDCPVAKTSLIKELSKEEVNSILNEIKKCTLDLRELLSGHLLEGLVENLDISNGGTRINFILGGEQYNITLVNGLKYLLNEKTFTASKLLGELRRLLFNSYITFLKDNFGIDFEKPAREGDYLSCPKGSSEFLSIFGMKHGRVHEKIVRFDPLFGLKFWNMSTEYTFLPDEVFKTLKDYITKVEK